MVQEWEFLDIRLGMMDSTDLGMRLHWSGNEIPLIWEWDFTDLGMTFYWSGNEVSLCTLRTTLGAVFQILGYVLSPSLIFSERGQRLRSFSCNWEMEGSRDLESSLRSGFLVVLSGLAGITGFIFSSTVGACSNECCFLGCGLAARGSAVKGWGAFRDNLRSKKEVGCKVNSTLL